jgi:hypothetical protein
MFERSWRRLYGVRNMNSDQHSLLVGANVLTFVANNAQGGQATDQITVTYQPPAPGNALVAAYGSGTTAVDSSGNGNTGNLLNTPTWTTDGRFGKAINFDGVDDFVSVPDHTTLDLTQSFTLSAWLNPSIAQTNFRAAVVKNYVQYLYAVIGGVAGCTSGGILGGYEQAGGGPQRIVRISHYRSTHGRTWRLLTTAQI